MRTDIPAFYPEWLENRIKEGFVLVRNPYNPSQVTRYSLSPDVVDLITFCTKNPAPMLPRMSCLEPYGQYWFVTITPYGKDIEPNVPDSRKVMESFRKLSDTVGVNCIGWRYDPVFIDDAHSVEWHTEAFEDMCAFLEGYTKTCVISFIDIYKKVEKNFPEVRAVRIDDRIRLGKALIDIGRSHGMTIKPCAEGKDLEPYGADCSGCMTVKMFETAIGKNLKVPVNPLNRKECACYITGDIGAYNTCGHLCRYCYANIDRATVLRKMQLHDPKSPFLIGNHMPGDTIHQAKQISWIDPQLRLML